MNTIANLRGKCGGFNNRATSHHMIILFKPKSWKKKQGMGFSWQILESVQEKPKERHLKAAGS